MNLAQAKGHIKFPGKILLCGEYVVMDGIPALSLAVDRWLSADWQIGDSNQDKGLCIHSELWTKARFFPWELPDDLNQSKSIEAALVACFKKLHPDRDLDCLLEIHVKSEINPCFGLGSSSAYSLALAYALYQVLEPCHDLLSRARHLAFRAQRFYQGQASGYDFATQTSGGLIEYQIESENFSEDIWTPRIKKFPEIKRIPDCLHFISNRKGAETAKLVKGGLSFIRQHPTLHVELQKNAEQLRSAFLSAFADPSSPNFEELIHSFKVFRQLFSQTPMYPEETAKAIAALNNCDRTWSFKTTGAGGEDSFIVVAPAQDWDELLKELEHLGFEEVKLQLEKGDARLSQVGDSRASPFSRSLAVRR